MDTSSILNNVKLILGVQDKDDLLNVYIQSAIDYIMVYCSITEIPPALYSTIQKMVIIQYRNKGVENEKSESKGSIVETYLVNYPDDIVSVLNMFREIRIVWD